MINEKVRRLLVEYNPFWSQPFNPEYNEREIFSSIEKFISEPQIVSLCGLRRVGKTTILNKIIFELIQKHGSASILYFSMDDFSELELLDVIDAFKEIHGIEPKFLVFDEIQKLSNWAEKVKILYDTKKYKIFVSGSESLFLKKGSRESLAGRIFEFEISKLSFSEYLNFVGKGHLAKKPLLHETELRAELEKYFLTSGFPEIIKKEDRQLIKQYIRNAVIEKIVFLDMPKIFPIENPQKIISILEILIDNPGMLVDLTSLSQELGISRQTLSRYFEYLEQSHLAVKLFNFSRNKISSEKRLKKFYPTILSQALAGKDDRQYLGKIAETACIAHTNAKFFWQNKYKDEVDIVLQHGKEIIPIEVKYRPESLETKGLEKFCKKFSCKKALMATKETRKTIKNGAEIQLIPLHEFLLKFCNKKNIELI